MPLPTGGNTRTITGYVNVPLDYPRWTTRAGLSSALDTAVVYLRSPDREYMAHNRHCDCETCAWLRDAKSFLRQHRRLSDRFN